jgi:hypothetical protein
MDLNHNSEKREKKRLKRRHDVLKVVPPIDSRKKFNRCSLQVRRIPLDNFRLPTDGRKWHQSARSRYSLLLKISTYANPDGTFQSKDGKTNFSPSAKTLQRHIAKKTLYRLTNDLRELGFLSWKREQEHYGRRTYTVHFQPNKHLSYSRKKQVSYSQEQVSPRHLITGVTMGTNPSLESLPSQENRPPTPPTKTVGGNRRPRRLSKAQIEALVGSGPESAGPPSICAVCNMTKSYHNRAAKYPEHVKAENPKWIEHEFVPESKREVQAQ